MILPRTPDPFLEHMFARMSPGAKFTFTPAQIDEIKKAFAARSRTSHAVDHRYSINLFGKSYYLVVLAGRERRSVPPVQLNVAKMSRLITWGAMSFACCGLLVALL